MDQGQITLIQKSSYIFLLLFFLVSCKSENYFQETKDLKGNWVAKKPVSFTFHVNDTTLNKVDVGFVLRNNVDYPYSNLYLFTKFVDPKGEEMIDTLQYYIANPDGTWIGKGFNTKEMFLVYRENLPIKDTGNYKLTVWQGMRTDKLTGIEDISLIVNKSTDK